MSLGRDLEVLIPGHCCVIERYAVHGKRHDLTTVLESPNLNRTIICIALVKVITCAFFSVALIG